MLNYVYTQAFNFTNKVQSSVDPRTGVFSVAIPIAQLTDYSRLGPLIPLSLMYTPFAQEESAFGIGFSLNFSHINIAGNGVLLTAAGESYRISQHSGLIKEQKGKHIKFGFTNGRNAGKGYRLVHKSGQVEYLEFIARTIFKPVKIESPTGRILLLDWYDHHNKEVRLRSIKDPKMAGNLCDFYYDESLVNIVVWPDTDEQYIVSLNFDEGYLVSLSFKGSIARLTWSFKYEEVGPEFGPNKKRETALTAIDSPMGWKESVKYSADTGMRYPGIALRERRVPRVVQHTQSPGEGQPSTVRSYEYTDTNYLGYRHDFTGVSIPQQHDFLYHIRGEYNYGSSEIVSSSPERTVKIHRTYNKFHLQWREVVECGENITDTVKEYNCNDELLFKDQPPNFMYLRKEVITQTDGIDKYVTGTQTLYDEDGNILKEVLPSGVVLENTWYPAEGEKDKCPSEVHGFVRFLKSTTITPANSNYEAPVVRHEVTYRKIAKLDGGAEEYAVVEDKKTHFSGGVKLSEKKYVYFNDTQDTEHGRLMRVRSTYFSEGSVGNRAYTIEEDYSFLERNRFIVRVEMTGFDGSKRTQRKTVSCLSGRLYEFVDSEGVKSQFVYDRLQRLIARTSAVDTKYEVTSTWEYVAGNIILETDSNNNKMRYTYDGLERLVREERKIEKEGLFRTLQEISYDDLGGIKREEIKDYIRSTPDDPEPKPISRYIDYHYDQWGFCDRREHSDGVVEITKFDPVNSRKHTAQTTAKRNGQDSKSGTVITRLNMMDLPTSIRYVRKNGEEEGREEFEYDGLGRVRRHQDLVGGRTYFNYDAYDRVIEINKPNGDVIRKEYALGEAAERITGISVNGFNLGSRKFDGLGRLVESKMGKRTETWRYVGGRALPSFYTSPSGDNVSYDYIPELDHMLLNVVGQSAQTGEQVSQIFNYDKSSGQLIEAKEEKGGTVELFYTDDGQLSNEVFKWGDKTPVSVSHLHSFQGLRLRFNGPDGAIRAWEYDQHGRVSKIEQMVAEKVDTTVSLVYDEFGRLEKREVQTEFPTPYTTQTIFEYDDFGREVSRVSSRNMESLHEISTLKQEWRADNRLRIRECSRAGVIICREEFDYDPNGRLVTHDCSGSLLPQLKGQQVKRQVFVYDSYDNITTCRSEFYSTGASEENLATYFFDKDDPTQLVTIKNTHRSFPKEVSLTYDANGRLMRDPEREHLAYDSLGRVRSISEAGITSTYGYDPYNGLVRQYVPERGDVDLYYYSNSLTNEIFENNTQQTSWMLADDCVSVKTRATASSPPEQTHVGVDSQRSTRSVIGTSNAIDYETYTAYGATAGARMLNNPPSFNGERPDPFSALYHLGNGTRSYSPELMRFISPDSLSPFGAGGINPYAYCSGDPVNLSDPSGQMSNTAIAGLVLGTVGIAFSLVSFGFSWLAAGSLLGMLKSTSWLTGATFGLGLSADVLGVASSLLEESDPELSRGLGWASLGLGVGGLAIGLTGVTVKSIYFNKQAKNQLIQRYTARTDNPMQNVMPLGDELFAFEDSVAAGRRLNIVAHGTRGYKSSTLVEPVAGVSESIKVKDVLDRLAQAGANIGDYQEIRVAACFSAYGGRYSVGAKLNLLTNKPVTAFKGWITPFPPPECLVNQYRKIAGVHGPEATVRQMSNYNFSIAKRNPNSVFTNPFGYLKFNYQPKTFGQ